MGRVDFPALAEANPFPAVNIIRGERLFRRDAYTADEYERCLFAKAFGEAVSKYRKIAEEVERLQVPRPDTAHRLRLLAGCRNRRVRLYRG